MPKKPPLSDKKRRWARGRDVTLRGKPLAYNAALQSRYRTSIMTLVREMTVETKTKVLKLFNSSTAKENFAQDASLASQARILMDALTKKFTLLFSLKSKSLAQRMMEGITRTSESALRGSLKELSGGLTLKTGVVPKGMEEASKALIAENVNLIESIPEQYLKDVSGSVFRSITTGRGLADLVPDLSKYTGEVDRRTKLIALDQTRKAYVAVNVQRMKSVGVRQFEWRHSGGSLHPRETHLRILHGNVFSFDNVVAEQIKLGVTNKADQGLPGFPVNCRCDMVPVINFEDE